MDARDLLTSDVFGHAPEGARAVLIRADVGPVGFDADFVGHDVLLLANLTGDVIDNPRMGAGSDSHISALLTSGFASDIIFGGSGPVGLDQLGAFEVYATVIPSLTQQFSVRAASTDNPDVDIIATTPQLANGQVLYLVEGQQTATVNQALAPDGPVAGGRPWQSIGSVTVTETTEKVQVVLSGASNGLVAADSVRLVRTQPVLPALKTLVLDHNPLDNRAHELFFSGTGASDDVGQSPTESLIIAINTDALTITGDEDDNPNAFYGVEFTAQVTGGVATFFVEGDLRIGGDRITVTGSNAASIVGGNNVIIDPGAVFEVSATDTEAGPGGGVSDLGGTGGVGGAGGIGGGLGNGGSGGKGGGAPFGNGSAGNRGGSSGSGSVGAVGQQGVDGSAGGGAVNNDTGGGAAGASGGGGAQGAHGVGQLGGAGGGRNGGNGSAGSSRPGFSGESGDVGGSGSGGQNVVTGPLISGGGAGGSGGGAGGGGGGGGGSGGSGGGGEGGEKAGLFSGGSNGTSGSRGGNGGGGGQGGIGGTGGQGGFGGGAVEIVALGDLDISSATFQALGGDGQDGLSSPGGRTNGANGQGGVGGSSGGGSGATGGRGGNGGNGGTGGGGGGGAGGTVKLVGTTVQVNGLDIDTSGGAGGSGAADGGLGRFLFGSNTAAFLTGLTVDASQESFAGTRGANPFLADGAATPYIPNLPGGAEVFGLTGLDAGELLSAEIFDGAPAAARAALIRLDIGPSGFSDDFVGYDVILFANLTDQALSNPQWGVGAEGHIAPLAAGGYANDLRFGGAGPQTLGQLDAFAVYMTLVPEDASWFNFVGSQGGIQTQAQAQQMENGQVLYLSESAVPVTTNQIFAPAVQDRGLVVSLTPNDAPVLESIPPQNDVNQVLSFDGNDRVEVASSPSLDIQRTITIETWFKVDQFANAWMPLVQKGNGISSGGRTYAAFIHSSGLVHLSTADGSQQTVDTPEGSVKIGKWHHFAGVINRDTGQLSVYLDGELVGSADVRTSDAVSHNRPLVIGDTLEISSNFSPFVGQIEEVRIWNVARTGDQIQSDMHRRLAGDKSGLAAYYLLGSVQDDGVVSDVTANGNDGSLAGLPLGLTGQMATFDGTDDHINVGPATDLVASDALTLEAWIKPTNNGTPGAGGIVVNKEGEYEIARFPDGTIRWAIANTGSTWNWVNTGFVAPLRQWTHVAVTFDAGAITTYANGNVVHTTTQGGATIGDVDGDLNDLWIGGRQGPTQFFGGHIADVRVWKTVRSEVQIQQFMNSRLSGTEQDLAGYWKLDGATGTTVSDSATGQNDGALSNGAFMVDQRPTLVKGRIRPVILSATDPDGDTVFFTANSDNPLVEVAVDGALLHLNPDPAFVGTARITVNAHDSAAFLHDWRNRTDSLSFDFTAGSAVTASGGRDTATVLTFEPTGTNGSIVSQAYGDRVTADQQNGFGYGSGVRGPNTPNITVEYGPDPLDVRRWNVGYGDRSDVIYRGGEGAGVLEVTLTADPGFEVALHSFDLAGFANSDYTINSVSVLDVSGQIVSSQANVKVEGDLNGLQHTHLDFDDTLSSPQLKIRIDARNLGNDSDNIGLDNIEFSQVSFTAAGVNAIYGTKFNDLDGDGVQDDNEPGLEGVTVFVDLDGDRVLDDGETTTVTDANGDYAVTGLFANSYPVTYDVVELSPGNQQPSVDAIVVDPQSVVAVQQVSFDGPSQLATGIDFGNRTVADAGPDQFVTEGDSVTLSASVTDPDLSNGSQFDLSWQVTADNGQSVPDGSGDTFGFTPNNQGLYTVTLTAMDQNDNNRVYTDSVLVVVENAPPVVVLTPTADITPNSNTLTLTTQSTFADEPTLLADDNDPQPQFLEGQMITFPPAATDPGDLDTLTFLWQVAASNGQLIPNGTEAGFSFTPVDNGTYTVTVTVTDDTGASDTATTTIEVGNALPLANAGGHRTVHEGDLVTFPLSTDPGALDTLTYLWQVTADNGQAIQDNILPNFTFMPNDNGIYTVKVTVTDNDGGEETDTATITVDNRPPTADAGPDQTVDEGDTVTFPTSADVGTADTLAYIWEVRRDTTVVASGDDPDFVFIPADDGEYLVTLTVTDDDGDSDTDTATITVDNLPPVLDAGPDQIIAEGDTVAFPMATDPGTDDDLAYTWQVTADGQLVASGTQPGFSFTPDDNGVFVVSVTVDDGDGGQDSDQATITVHNFAPENVSAGPDQTVVEGDVVNLVATFDDPGVADTHTFLWQVTSDNDQVVADGTDGTLVFTAEDDGLYTVKLTISDDDGGVDTATVTVTSLNVDPQVTVLSAVPGSVQLGQLVTFSGTLSDVIADDIRGKIVYGDGTVFPLSIQPTGQANGRQHYGFSASHIYNGPGQFEVELSISDDDSTATTVIPLGVSGTSQIAGRHIFYNRSSFDGNEAAANANDDGAIATDKQALLPGGTASLANYTSYSRGINGIMVDIADRPDTPLGASDFQFHVGHGEDLSQWTAAPAPQSVTVRSGAGVGGSDRVTVIWSDNAIQKQWLQVTVKQTAATGLDAPDVFYFGNAIGETGDSTTDAHVGVRDQLLVRLNPRSPVNPAGITNVYDFNRDRDVGAADELLARVHATSPVTALKLIAVPAAPPTSGVTGLVAFVTVPVADSQLSVTGAAVDPPSQQLLGSTGIIAPTLLIDRTVGRVPAVIAESDEPTNTNASVVQIDATEANLSSHDRSVRARRRVGRLPARTVNLRTSPAGVSTASSADRLSHRRHSASVSGDMNLTDVLQLQDDGQVLKKLTRQQDGV